MQQVKKFENVKPRLGSPYDPTEFNSFPRDITLTWEPVPKAVSYEIEIQVQVPEKTWHMLQNYPVETKDTKYSFEFVGANYGRWRVVAINGEGIKSSYSEWSHFHCKK